MVLDGCKEPTAADHGDVLYEIGKSDTIGRYMVASRDIKPEEVIFTDQPAVIGPDNAALPMCLVCWRKLSGSYKCKLCGWPLCGDVCRDTKAHAKECKFFSERKSQIQVTCFGVPNRLYDAILPLRVLLLKLTNKRVFKLVCHLMDHTENQTEKKQKRYSQIAELIRNTWGFSKDFTVNEIKHVLGILAVNSFCVHDGAEDGMGLIGLYPWTSLMSHCCVPNVKIVTKDDFSYICEATVNIPAGNEIVTSYHHYYYHLFGTMYRRSDIQQTWKFDCICHRCRDPTELGTYVSGIKCEKCKSSYLLPAKPLDYNTAWECIGCDNTDTSDNIANKLAKFETEIDMVLLSEPEKYEELLQELRCCLHENHYLISDCKRRLIDIYGHEEGFEYSKLGREIVENKSEYCRQLLDLACRLSPGKSELRGYLLWERHGAQLRLAQMDWLNMKCSTQKYIDSLKVCCESLKEIIDILGPIRDNSEEGTNGLKAKNDLQTIKQQLLELQDK